MLSKALISIIAARRAVRSCSADLDELHRSDVLYDRSKRAKGLHAVCIENLGKENTHKVTSRSYIDVQMRCKQA